MMYDLPRCVTVGGTEYAVETDYRAILDIFAVLSDPNLTNEEKGIGLLGIFYINFRRMPEEHFAEAVRQCFWFINGGSEEKQQKTAKLMDWEQDFPLLIAPINRVAGRELRAVEYLHWWSFLSYYYEIGDCYFAQIVRIRDLKAKGKLKDKADREFYSKNREVVDLKVRYSEVEESIIRKWI